MRRIVVTETNEYVINITDEEYEMLCDGDIIASELTDGPEAEWVNGSLDWEDC